MATAKTQPLSTPDDRSWGYRFGCDGVVTKREACRLLGDVHERTLYRRIAERVLRKGYAKPNQKRSGLRICRRSIEDYLAACKV